jgi:hypothetical protein
LRESSLVRGQKDGSYTSKSVIMINGMRKMLSLTLDELLNSNNNLTYAERDVMNVRVIRRNIGQSVALRTGKHLRNAFLSTQ